MYSTQKIKEEKKTSYNSFISRFYLEAKGAKFIKILNY